MTQTARQVLGAAGEQLARRHLEQRGYRFVAANWRRPYGELDLIMRDGDALVFVEVKTRAYDDPAPEDQVNPAKRHQITKAARYYLSRYGTVQPPSRFDVVAVVWPNNADPLIRHTPHAFEASF